MTASNCIFKGVRKNALHSFPLTLQVRVFQEEQKIFCNKKAYDLAPNDTYFLTRGTILFPSTHLQ